MSPSPGLARCAGLFCAPDLAWTMQRAPQPGNGAGSSHAKQRAIVKTSLSHSDGSFLLITAQRGHPGGLCPVEVDGAPRPRTGSTQQTPYCGRRLNQGRPPSRPSSHEPLAQTAGLHLEAQRDRIQQLARRATTGLKAERDLPRSPSTSNASHTDHGKSLDKASNVGLSQCSGERSANVKTHQYNSVTAKSVKHMPVACCCNCEHVHSSLRKQCPGCGKAFYEDTIQLSRRVKHPSGWNSTSFPKMSNSN